MEGHLFIVGVGGSFFLFLVLPLVLLVLGIRVPQGSQTFAQVTPRSMTVGAETPLLVGEFDGWQVHRMIDPVGVACYTVSWRSEISVACAALESVSESAEGVEITRQSEFNGWTTRRLVDPTTGVVCYIVHANSVVSHSCASAKLGEAIRPPTSLGLAKFLTIHSFPQFS